MKTFLILSQRRKTVSKIIHSQKNPKTPKPRVHFNLKVYEIIINKVVDFEQEIGGY